VLAVTAKWSLSGGDPAETRARSFAALGCFAVAVSLFLTLFFGVVTHGSFAAAAENKPVPITSYICQGAQVTLFDNTNADKVKSGATSPTFNTNGKAYCLTYIQTYHWNSGKGSSPGQIGVTRSGGPLGGFGGQPAKSRFAAQGSAGDNDVANENWYADVPTAHPTLLDGSYTCYDSSPTTWSFNASSAGGFCIVYADPAVPPGTAAATTTTSISSTTTTLKAAAPTSSSSSSSTWLWLLIALAAIIFAAAVYRWRDAGLRRFFGRDPFNPFDDDDDGPDGPDDWGPSSPLDDDSMPIPSDPPDDPDGLELNEEYRTPEMPPIAGDSAGPIDDMM